MTQPAGRYTYCLSKARNSWSIFRKISPYNLLGHAVHKHANHYTNHVEFNPTKQGVGLSVCIIPALSGGDFGLVGDELEGDRVLRHLQNHQNVVRRLALYVDAIDFHHLKYIIINFKNTIFSLNLCILYINFELGKAKFDL